MSVCVVYGTRPEMIKLSVLCSEFNVDTLSIGQQPHLTTFYKSLMPEPTCHVDLENGNLNDRFSCAVSKIGKAIVGYDIVIVQGDTMTAAAGALAAFHNKIDIAHVEAGLRTRDISSPFPEEAYRSLISRIAKWNFCPTQFAKENLTKEMPPGEVHVTGNTVIDLVSQISAGKDTSCGNEVIVTLHRRENIKNLPHILEEIKKSIKLHPELEWILPVHPNPDVKRAILRGLKDTKVRLVDPIDYPDFLDLIRRCRLIVTDSGGLQEEAAFFKKKVVVCRKNTERPEGVHDGFSVLALENISNAIDDCLKSYECVGNNPYGDGKASYRIASILGLQRKNE